MLKKKKGKLWFETTNLSYKKDLIISISLFFLGLISRLPFLEKYQSHWDGPQYSIGVLRYSLSQSTPTIPGYPLYIGLGKVINYFSHNPHFALLLVGVLFSGLGAVSIYWLGKIIFNRNVGIISSLILLSSPAFYYFGITTYGYVVLPTMVSLLALSVYSSFIKEKKYATVATIVFALSIALRPQEIFYILPLYLLSIWGLKIKEIVVQIFINVVVGLLWLIPVANTIGGVANYINQSLYSANSQSTTGLQLLFNGHLYDILILRIGRGIYLTLGLSSLFLIIFLLINIINKLSRKARKRLSLLKKRKRIIFYSIWMFPPIFFNIVMRVEHAGYQFTYLVPLIIFSAFAIYKLFNKNKILFIIVSVLVVAFNLFSFFRDRDPSFTKPYSPTSFHYSEIRKNDIKMKEKIDFIKSHYSNNSTIIVIGTPELFRPVMYHLPEYHVYEFDALTTDDPKYKDIERIGKNYSMQELNNKNREFSVSKDIKTIVIFDDLVKTWSINSAKIKALPFNTYLAIIGNSETSVFIYGKEKFIQK